MCEAGVRGVQGFGHPLILTDDGAFPAPGPCQRCGGGPVRFLQSTAVPAKRYVAGVRLTVRPSRPAARAKAAASWTAAPPGSLLKYE
ncbi:hypothetical protein GCM10010214_01040 [Streptomyces abikoensis]|nr:hypothetical protein GCM10010214_01040 [Streptomyces abikoensis]